MESPSIAIPHTTDGQPRSVDICINTGASSLIKGVSINAIDSTSSIKPKKVLVSELFIFISFFFFLRGII